MRKLVIGALALIAALAVAGPAAARGGQEAETKVIGTGLDNPRGLAVARDGTILVAEAGRGGPGPCGPSPEGGEVCLGDSGAVSALRPGHKGGFVQKRVLTGLPSLAGPTGEAATGPHDVALARHRLLVTIGLGADPARRADFGDGGALLGQLVAAEPFGGARPVADLAAFEGEADPDQGLPGTAPDSNPYGLLADGRLLAATDAGGNTLLRVGRKGEVSPLAVFPPRFVPGPEPGSEIPMQPVPTAVTRGPDGALYVSELTGFPFPPGGARIWRVPKGGEPEVYAEGFTHVIDIAFDRTGRLHVLEISADRLLSDDPAGALIRVERDGSRTELAAGELTAPGALAFGRDGAVYVSNKSVEAGEGEVLRIPS
jgi:hypothetical protein